MLLWKPANTVEAVLAVQEAIIAHPMEIRPGKLYYYVTAEECHAYLGKEGIPGVWTDEEEHRLFNGIDGGKIYRLPFPKHGCGFFIDEETLKAAGIKPVTDWRHQIQSERTKGRKTTRTRE